VPSFFLPPVEDDPELAESTYAAIKKFAEEQTGWRVTDRRIFRVEYTHDSQEHVAEVGSADNRIGEVCVAILETPECFLVCTRNRGVERGEPMLVGIPHTIVDFE
jgi:hypothetical protein